MAAVPTTNSILQRGTEPELWQFANGSLAASMNSMADYNGEAEALLEGAEHTYRWHGPVMIRIMILAICRLRRSCDPCGSCIHVVVITLAYMWLL